jgi:STAS-like domain of unknown function (DUF4325)
MSEVREITIASDFSPFPVGRIPEDGDYNGQSFRERLLSPALREAIAEGGRVVVWLDGLKSCGSSFLESVFGGLVREDGFSKNQLKKHLEVKSNSKTHTRYLIAISRYIENASR